MPRSQASDPCSIGVLLSGLPGRDPACGPLRLKMALPSMCEGQWSANLGKAKSSLQWESCFHMGSALYLKDILICSALWPSRQHSWCSKANALPRLVNMIKMCPEPCGSLLLHLHLVKCMFRCAVCLCSVAECLERLLLTWRLDFLVFFWLSGGPKHGLS